MDQEDTMDFKALRAKFQDEEFLLKQHKVKPALPEKPKVVPPPQSPTHYLPAGARPSLLTSINQSLEGKTPIAPRVIFKEEAKESKKPLIQTKGKDKSEGKVKASKDKTSKVSKEKLDEESPDQKQKKENGKDKKNLLVLPGAQKESTAELVPANPPPKSTLTKKKGFLNFMKSSKKDTLEITPEPILDTPSSDAPGAAPLIPVPSDFSNAPLEPEIQAPASLIPINLTLPDSGAAVEIAPPSTIPQTSDSIPPAAITPVILPPEILSPESKIPLEIENPALPVSRPSSQNEIIPKPLSAAPTPPPSSPEPEIAAEAVIEAVKAAAAETPPADPPSIPPSPKPERSISALSALERAEDMSPGKRMSPADQRIFNALEKARRKTTRTTTNSTQSYSITPPPEELSRSQSPARALPALPPIDYEDRAGNALQSKPVQVNGLDHRQASPLLEGIAEEGSEGVPELLVIPPPPPRNLLPDPESVGPAPEKPPRPPFVNLTEFIPPPPLEDDEIPAPPEFSETDTTDVPEFDEFAELASGVHSPELPSSEWGNEELTVPDVLDGQSPTQYYNNGITLPEMEIHPEPAFGDEYQDNLPAQPSFSVSQDSTPVPALQTVGSSGHESTENTYEDISTSASKKKGKTDGGKKHKGSPKNPYAEAAQETNQEKPKTGRFGKSEKKAAAAEGPDEKQLKKKEKQRLEKEKKELKEKIEREKKEQKEREKKENELKKKFKITGQEDAMYQAKVTVTTKGRKNDLPVKDGDVISIIRTTNCPKGKWLARDNDNNYGYVSVDHVELDIKEMLELGKKTIRGVSNNVPDTEVDSPDKRASNHFPLESFTDDSEEWTGDEDDTLSPATETADPLASAGHSRTLSMPDMGNKDLSVNHSHSHSDISAEGSQARYEALQKLTTFFHSPKPVEPTASSTEQDTSRVFVAEETAQTPEDSSTQETDFEPPEMIILPPPDLYADLTVE